MQQKTVYLFALDTLADWEPAFTIAAINNQAWQTQPGRYIVKTVGESREPVKSLGGLTILPDLTLAELQSDQSALLILPGANTLLEEERAHTS